MSKLLVRSFSISIDGYGAGPRQDLENPLGVGGPAMFEWFFHTQTWQRMHGGEGGETGADDAIAAKGFEGIGAWIIGPQHVRPRARPVARRRAGRAGGATSRRTTCRSSS